MTGPENERLAKLEERLDGLCERFDRVEKKLDEALECKADKSEVQVLRDRMWNLAVGTASTAIVALLGLGIYLLQSHIVP